MVYIDKVYGESIDGYKLDSKARIKIVEYADRFDVQTFDLDDKILFWSTISKLTGQVEVGRFDKDGRIEVPKVWE